MPLDPFDPLSDDSTEREGWAIRRRIDEELIHAINRMGNTEKELASIKQAMFGLPGQAGVLGTLSKVDKDIDDLNKKISAESGKLHTKIEDKIGRLYLVIIGGCITLLSGGVLVVFFGPR